MSRISVTLIALTFLLCAGCASVVTPSLVHAFQIPGAPITVTGSGGTFDAPTTDGQPIAIAGVKLSDGTTASVSCPVTVYGGGQDQAQNWSCGGGKLVVNGATVDSVSGRATYMCSGNGTTQETYCFYAFNGMTSIFGPVQAQASAGTGNAQGSVLAFSATYGPPRQ